MTLDQSQDHAQFRTPEPKILPTQASLPSIGNMLFSLTEALKSNLTQIASKGVLLAEDNLVSKRISLCLGCEFLIQNSERCIKCGCYMNMKTRLQVSKCPVGKW